MIEATERERLARIHALASAIVESRSSAERARLAEQLRAEADQLGTAAQPPGKAPARDGPLPTAPPYVWGESQATATSAAPMLVTTATLPIPG